MMKKSIFFLLLTVLSLGGASCLQGQVVSRNIKTQQYKDMQEKMSHGWNTWFNENLLTYAYVPDGFAINLAFKSSSGRSEILREVRHHSENTILHARANFGAYTSMEQAYNGVKYLIETASVDDRLYVCVTPGKPSNNQLIVEASLPWDTDASLGVRGDCLYGEVGSRRFQVRSSSERITNNYTGSTAPKLIFTLNDAVCLYTGETVQTAAQIRNIIREQKQAQEAAADKYGALSEIYRGMQTSLSWNTIYDAANRRVISPVSRNWSHNWGGFVLFDWDTYFASYMFGLFNKEMAYANAVEITKAITPAGFIPNFQGPYYRTSYDRSQPPIGSMVIYELYRHYGDRWLLEEVYDELLTWNKWWPEHRDFNGYLAWGTDRITQEDRQAIKDYYKKQYASDNFFGGGCNWQDAAYESGLDNSPMFDNVKFNTDKCMMELADVGLISMYIMDCNYLIKIAEIMGDRKADIKGLKERRKKYAKALETLWNEEAGIYMNKYIRTGEFQNVLTPCNFYPLLAGTCSQRQAEIMMERHYFNPDEFHGEYVIPSVARNHPSFKDNIYWRGRIWAPMNFLVYKGMCNYDLSRARKDLVQRSKKLFLENWLEGGRICENYNAVTGKGGVEPRSDSFYHWGALLGFMSFIEEGYMDENTLKPVR